MTKPLECLFIGHDYKCNIEKFLSLHDKSFVHKSWNDDWGYPKNLPLTCINCGHQIFIDTQAVISTGKKYDGEYTTHIRIDSIYYLVTTYYILSKDISNDKEVI